MGNKHFHEVSAPANLAAAVVSPVPPVEQLLVAIGSVRGDNAKTKIYLNDSSTRVAAVEIERHGSVITLHRAGGKTSTYQVQVATGRSLQERQRSAAETSSVIKRFLKEELGIN